MNPPSVLYHGTSALALGSIRRDGLVEPMPGRGVGLTDLDHIAMAKYAAFRAEWVQRHRHGSAETVGLGALVAVDPSKLDDLIHAPLGVTINPHRGWYCQHVPPAAIVSIETFPLALPERHSLADNAMAAQGVGFDRTDAKVSVPTMQHVRERIAAGDPCDRVRPDQYEAVFLHARKRVESWRGLQAPSPHALRLAREHAAKTTDPPVPDPDRLSRFRDWLSEPGIASLIIDGAYYEREEIAAALGVELDALDPLMADKIANGEVASASYDLANST